MGEPGCSPELADLSDARSALLGGLLGNLVGTPVRCAEAFYDVPGVDLFPEELALVGRAVEKRRREFTTVRACARQALADLGRPPSPLLHDARGAPLWPAGIVGSLTHCAGFRGAAVAESCIVRSLGVDAEPNAPLPDGLLETVAQPDEISMLRRLPHAGGHAWDRLLFSAKESVYKTWYPLTGLWLGFEDARISISATGTFEARFLVDGPVVDASRVDQLFGRWAARRGLLVTAIVLPAASSS